MALLRKAVSALTAGVGGRIAIHELSFVRPVDDCQLHAISAESDIGVVATMRPGEFDWTLAPESWLQTDELLEPFGQEQAASAFQDLNPASGPEVIYATDRAW